MADVVSLAREVKMIRSGLPIDELLKRSRLIDKLEKQFGDVKSDIKKFERVSTEASREAKKATKQLNAYQKEFNKVKQQISKDLKKLGGEINKNTKGVQEAFKRVKDGYDKINKPFERLTKGLDKYVGAASLGFGIAGVAISFMALKSSERNQAAFDRQLDRLQVGMSKQLGQLYTYKTRFEKINQKIDVLNKEADLASQAIIQNRKIADRAQKQANDITYEARVKIGRLNDTVAQANSNASKALVQQNLLKGQLAQAQTEAKTAAIEASKARIGVQLVDSKATTAQVQAKTAQTEAQQARVGVKLLDSKATIAQVEAKQAQVEAKQATAKALSLQPQVTQAITTANQAVAIARNIKVPPPVTTVVNQGDTTTAKQQKMSQSEFNQYLRQNGIILRVDAAQTTAQTALEVASKGAAEPIGNKALGIGSTALSLGANNQASINRLDAELRQLRTNPPSLLDPRVPELQQKIREREAVDQQALQKINEIQASNALLVPAVIAGLTPAMQAAIGRGNQNLLEQLPDKTATAVQNAPCSGRGCGGRTAARVDGLADELGALRNQVNGLPNTVGNVINAGNAAANAAQLGLLNTINGKLGTALPNGGVGGMLSRIVKSSAVDKALQAMIFITTVHNAFHVSADLGRSLFSLSSSAINATLRTMGVITADDTPIDVGAIISGQIEAQIKALIGVENWTQISRALASANRIYQSGSNVISNIWSMADSTRNVLEYTAENTGRIGNALKRERVVGQDSYPDMAEKVTARTGAQRKLDNIIEGIEEFSSGVSALDSTFQEVISIQDTIVEYKRSTKEFKDSIAESPIPAVAANLAAQARRDEEKAVSKAPVTVADVDRSAAEQDSEVA